MNKLISLKSQNEFHVSQIFPADLTQDQIKLIEDNSLFVNYQERDVIFRQNTITSHIIFLKSGYVKIYKEGRNSKVIILKVATNGSFLGLMSALGGDVHEYSSSSITKSEVVFIDKKVFLNIIHKNEALIGYFFNTVSRDGLYIFDKLLSQSHKQLPGRIAEVILYFSEVIYKSDIFEFPLTRKELAELAGTTKESFIRTLTEFKNDKIIDLNGRKVEIKSKKIIKILSQLG